MTEAKKQAIQERFSIIEGDITLSTLSDNAYRIYGALRLYTLGKNACWPSVRTLAEHLGKSEATIQRGLKELAEKRAEFDNKPVIKVSQRRDEGGRRASNRYEIWPEHNVTTTVKSGEEDHHANMQGSQAEEAKNSVDNSAPPRKYEPDHHANMREKTPLNIIEEKKKEKETSACSEPSASLVEEPTPTRSQVLVEGKEKPQKAREPNLMRLSRLERTGWWHRARGGDQHAIALFRAQAPEDIYRQLPALAGVN